MKEESSQSTLALPSFSLEGRLAVVTGASAGIGRTIALAYSLSRATLVLVGRSPGKLAEVASAVENAGGRAYCISADLAKFHDVQSMATTVSGLADRNPEAPLVLVNCAGLAFTKMASEVTEEDWDRVLDVHVKGAFFCCQLLAPLMIKKGYGKIINLSSTWSVSTDLGKSVYGLAKAAVSQMTAALSTEWAPRGIRVNAIAPTATLTNSARRNFAENPARAERLLSRIKLGRFANPTDLVGSSLFLASEASDFITGHTLFVDGGWHAGG